MFKTLCIITLSTLNIIEFIVGTLTFNVYLCITFLSIV